MCSSDLLAAEAGGNADNPVVVTVQPDAPVAEVGSGSDDVKAIDPKKPPDKKHPVKTPVDLNTKSGFAFVRLPGSMSAPFVFAVNDNPETIRAEGEMALTEDSIVNGRISKPGEIGRASCRERV